MQRAKALERLREGSQVRDRENGSVWTKRQGRWICPLASDALAGDLRIGEISLDSEDLALDDVEVL